MKRKTSKTGRASAKIGDDPTKLTITLHVSQSELRELGDAYGTGLMVLLNGLARSSGAALVEGPGKGRPIGRPRGRKTKR